MHSDRSSQVPSGICTPATPVTGTSLVVAAVSSNKTSDDTTAAIERIRYLLQQFLITKEGENMSRTSLISNSPRSRTSPISIASSSSSLSSGGVGPRALPTIDEDQRSVVATPRPSPDSTYDVRIVSSSSDDHCDITRKATVPLDSTSEPLDDSPASCTLVQDMQRRKVSLDDFELCRVLGRGSVGKVCF
jgi:hypothetical protein